MTILSENSNIPLKHTPDPQKNMFVKEILVFLCENLGVCSRGLLESSWTLTNDNGSCVEPGFCEKNVVETMKSPLSVSPGHITIFFNQSNKGDKKKTLVGGFNPFEKL